MEAREIVAMHSSKRHGAARMFDDRRWIKIDVDQEKAVRQNQSSELCSVQ